MDEPQPSRARSLNLAGGLLFTATAVFLVGFAAGEWTGEFGLLPMVAGATLASAFATLAPLKRRRLLLALVLTCAPAIGGVWLGTASTRRVYSRACVHSEEVRLAILRFSEEHGALPASLDAIEGIDRGRQFTAPDLLQWRRIDDRQFTLSCRGKILFMAGTQDHPMMQSK